MGFEVCERVVNKSFVILSKALSGFAVLAGWMSGAYLEALVKFEIPWLGFLSWSLPDEGRDFLQPIDVLLATTGKYESILDYKLQNVRRREDEGNRRRRI